MIKINKKIEKYKIQKMLEKDYSDGNWESMIDKVAELMVESYSEGYSIAPSLSLKKNLMYEVDMFSTRFIMMKKIFDDRELIETLNIIKKDTDKLADVMHGEQGPTYRTNYHIANVHAAIFTPLLEKINKHLNKYSLRFDISIFEPPWYSEYGEYDQHSPHIHDQKQVDLMKVEDAYKYSGIINLSNFGSVGFINPNPSSFFENQVTINSEYGTVLLFPSNVWHYVRPHGLRNKTRATFSFNGLLRGLDKHVNINNM